jgi:hypothetical protein
LAQRFSTSASVMISQRRRTSICRSKSLHEDIVHACKERTTKGKLSVSVSLSLSVTVCM